MGKIYDSLLAGSSGRTGRIVVANVSGNEISRIRPKKRTKAPSENQLMVQKRMKNAIEFMASYRAYACKHFGHRVGMRSSYNQAFTNVTTNMVIDFTAKTITPNYPNIVFSKGALLGVLPTSMTLSSPDVIELNWQNNANSNVERETDMLQILIAIEGELTTYFMENVSSRVEESYNINLTNFQLGKEIHIWLAFRSSTKDQVSNSVYLGSITT
ncbi:DUF6266 family protein [Empedobacter falsenii]